MSRLGDMCKVFMERDLSIDMRLLITDKMKDMTVESKLKRADQVIDIINSCQTNSEILPKLQEQKLV